MKYAIVTGGTKGIGKAIAIELLARGFFVYTNYATDDHNAASVVKEFSALSPHFFIQKADQADKFAFQEFVNHCIENSSTIDCIVCNTGMTLRKKTWEISDTEWELVMQVVVNSHFSLIRDCYSKIPDYSRVIFIGSMLGIVPHATSLPYGVTKAAIHALAKNLVKDMESKKTTVNVVAPGFVETDWQKEKPEEIRKSICEKTALKRFASTEEIVSAFSFCMDNEFVNGSVIEVTGGYSYK